jgi:hypothetical protein
MAHPLYIHTYIHNQYREHMKCSITYNVLINSVSDYNVDVFNIPNIVLTTDYLFMTLQPLWTLAVFQFLNPYTVGRTPWTGDQPVARPLPTQESKITE